MSNDGGADNGYVVYSQFQCNKTATLTDIYLYVATAAGAGRVAIYTDSSGSPHTLLAQSRSQTLASGWNDFSGFSQDLVNGTYYWLAFQANNATTAFDSGYTGSNYKYQSQSYGSFPSTASSLTTGTGEYCIYGQYSYSAISSSDSSNAASDALGSMGPKAADASNAAADLLYSFAPWYLDASNAAVDTFSATGGGVVTVSDASALTVDAMGLTGTFGVSDSSNLTTDSGLIPLQQFSVSDASNAAVDTFDNLSGTYTLASGIPSFFGDNFNAGFVSPYLWNLCLNSNYYAPGVMPAVASSPTLGNYSCWIKGSTYCPICSEKLGEADYGDDPWTQISTWTGQNSKEVWSQQWVYVPSVAACGEIALLMFTSPDDTVFITVQVDPSTGLLFVEYCAGGSVVSQTVALSPLGQWFQITVHAKVATTSTSNDGTYEAWIGAKKVLSLVGSVNNYYDGNSNPMYAWSYESYLDNEGSPSSMQYYLGNVSLYAPGSTVLVADFSQPGADSELHGPALADASNLSVDVISSQLARLYLSDAANQGVDTFFLPGVFSVSDLSNVTIDSVTSQSATLFPNDASLPGLEILTGLNATNILFADASNVSVDSFLLFLLLNDVSNAGADSGGLSASLPFSDQSNVSVDGVSARALVAFFDASKAGVDLSAIGLSLSDFSNLSVEGEILANQPLTLYLSDSSLSIDKATASHLLSAFDSSSGVDAMLFGQLLVSLFDASLGVDSAIGGQFLVRSVVLRGGGGQIVLIGE
jgi:hypothetical protein